MALNGKHQACPICGGKDRFRFDDKDGRGTYYCNNCGAGDGFALVMGVKGVTFREAASLVREAVPGAQLVQVQAKPDHRARLRKLYAQSTAAGDEVRRYLTGRGIIEVPHSLREIARVKYYDDGKAFGEYPAMAAIISNVRGEPVTLHLTYLHQGKKAPVQSPKKIISGGIQGGAVRLYPATDRVAVAEGIETALAARQRFGWPAWATVTAGGMESLELPGSIRHVLVCGDNDRSYTGHAAAYALAKRLVGEGRNVEVRIPDEAGTDWADHV